MVSMRDDAGVADRRREQAREQLGRLEALIDVVLAQLAHTDADNPRWHRLRAAIQADARLKAGLAALPEAELDLAAHRVARCAARWLRRVEPVLALSPAILDVEQDNPRLFLAIRSQAGERREALRRMREQVAVMSERRVTELAELPAAWGLGLLPELDQFQTATAFREPFDEVIHATLADAEAWCGPQGERFRAALGLCRLAEAALLARLVAPELDVTALFGRYAGSTELRVMADLHPNHILAFDAQYARDDSPASSPEQPQSQVAPIKLAIARDFFESRFALGRALDITLPHRPFDALFARLGAAEMHAMAAEFDAPTLQRCFALMGPDLMAQAILDAGAGAVARLTTDLGHGESMQAVLSAFRPIGRELTALLKSNASRTVVELVASVGPEEVRRQVRGLGADGLTHLLACVGLPGAMMFLAARSSNDYLARLRTELGRRTVRLTLQSAAGRDVAHLLRRGLSAQQLQRVLRGADRRHPGLGAQVLGQLAAMPDSDEHLRTHLATLSQAMDWDAPN